MFPTYITAPLKVPYCIYIYIYIYEYIVQLLRKWPSIHDRTFLKPLRIITATSVGHEILGISCKDPRYTESDVLEDDFVAQMALHRMNMFFRSFDGDEDDFCD